MEPMGYPLTVDPLGSPGGSPKVLAHRPKCPFATWRGLCQAGAGNCSKGAILAVWGGLGVLG